MYPFVKKMIYLGRELCMSVMVFIQSRRCVEHTSTTLMSQFPVEFTYPSVILELATNFWLLVLSILHNHKRIIKQASLSHWVAEYNLKVSSVVVQNGEHE